MKLSYQPYQLKLKHPFKLAYGTRTQTDIVLVELEHEGVVGYGEASLPPYLGESLTSVSAFLDKLEMSELDVFKFRDTVIYLDAVEAGNNAAKAAVDIALHDLLGKLEGKPLAELMSITLDKEATSSYTIGMSTSEELESKLAEANDYPMIKLKLGSSDDKALVSSYLESSSKPYYVDVNQGWKDPVFASDMVEWLSEEGALFVEQPLPAEMLEETSRITESSRIPIVADEAVRRLADLDQVSGAYSGVNVKLMKSTGIFEAMAIIDEARKLDLKVLVGCMAESSCAVTAGANLASLADWADLDAPALISNDPFRGVQFIDGKLSIPQGVGLGIEKVTPELSS